MRGGKSVKHSGGKELLHNYFTRGKHFTFYSSDSSTYFTNLYFYTQNVVLAKYVVKYN